MINNLVFVRTGGGWEPLETFIEKKHKEIVENVYKLLEVQKITLERLVYDLCLKY